VIFLTFLGLFITGRNSLGDVSDYTIRDIVSGSDSYAALMWAAYITSGIGILLSVGRKILSLQEALDAWLNGLRSLVLACCILVLGWTMGKVCEVLNTADYLVSLSSGILTPELLPAVTFLTAAAISFSTGSSWATMAIMVPIVAPMSIELMEMEANVVIQSPVFLSTFASILSGAVFGDHCSPISDTTILSSTASGADHIDHVRTQLPYALTTGGIALFFGYLMVGYGYSYWISIGLGIGSIILALKLFGKPLPRTQLK
jgi:Na+/H+ antiporter NhaC